MVLLAVLGAACGGTLEGEYAANHRQLLGADGAAGVAGPVQAGDQLASTDGAAEPGAGATAAGGAAASTRSGSGGTSGSGSNTASGSGGQGAGSEPGAANGATDVGVTADTITVGGTTVLSGPVAEYGKQGLYGFDSRLQHVNAAGGINGRKLKLIFYNDEFDPAKGLAFFRRLVEGDKIFLAVGSSSVDAVADYVCFKVAELQGSPLPFIGDPGLSPKSYMPDKYPCLFPTGPGFRHGAWIRGQWAKSLGAKTIAQIYTNDSKLGDISLMLDQYREAYEANGLEVVRFEPMDPGSSSCATQISNVKAAKPDYLFLNLVPPNDLILCLQAMQSQVPSYKPPVGTQIQDPLEVFIEAGGEFVEGFFASTAFYALDNPAPGMREYVADMQRYHPDVDAGGSIAMALYLSGKVNEYLISQLGQNVTRQGIIDLANNLRGWDSGMGTVMSWSPHDHAGSKTNFMVRVEGGKFVRVGEPITSNCPAEKCAA